MRIGILAMEASGDLLGAGLMKGLRTQRPDIYFEGIGGERMQAEGLDSWVPMDTLSVMGLAEVIRHLPRLLRLRRRLAERWRQNPPDCFVGIDAPDFNLGLERQLRDAGIKTVHYVSPTVWAWRSSRVKTLRAAVDLLLGIFPFEVEFLRKHRVPVEYVGHPLARDLPLEPDRSAARLQLGLAESAPVLAVLPGSRNNEVKSLTAPFLQAAARCRAALPELQVVVPLVNTSTERAFVDAQRQAGSASEVTRIIGGTHAVLAAADVVLTASGTATFEAMLSKRPMVVGYKLHWLTYLIAHTFGLVKVKHVALANILADEELAPEFIQDACHADNLTPAILGFFRDPQKVRAIAARYRDIHLSMQLDTNAEAASAILALLALDDA